MEILLNECSDYMLTYELLNLLNTCNEAPIDKPFNEAPIVEKPVVEEAPIVEKPVIKAPAKKHTIFYPELDDSLFWCMYVNEHGISAYETQRLLKKNMVNTMMTIKRKMFDYFNNDKQQLLKTTNHKVTIAIANEIKCDIMTRRLASFQNMIACCVYWKCPIVVELCKNIYAKFVSNHYVSDTLDEQDAETVLLYIVKSRNRTRGQPTFAFALETDREKTVEKLREMRQSWYCINHYQKPIGAISNYSLSELVNIATIVCEGDEISQKKQEIYHSIILKLGTMTVKQFV